jgi:FKBP-type peptidyl-prolyl cis-trans isomerase 2
MLMAEIEIGKTVTLKYIVKLDDGTVIDKAEDSTPLVFTIGDPNIISGMVDAVLGLKEGDTKSFSVEPKDAYGEHDPAFVRELPRKLFPEDINICEGDQLAAINKNGQEIPFTVIEIRAAAILADFNHILAGKTLHFDIEIISVTETAV